MRCYASSVARVYRQKELPLNGFPASWLIHFDAPFRWTDPKTWPWFLYIWLAFFLSGWLMPLWRWFQREQAKSWPATTGQITSAYINEPKRLLGLDLQSSRSRTYDATLEYSYTLSGEAFLGKYKRNCASEEEAEEFLRGLQGQTVSVQYHPNKPARSALPEATVETLLHSRPPAIAADELNASSLSARKRAFFTLCAVLSLAGLILSLWVHIGALLGRRVAPEYFFWGLHMGIFVVFLPAVFLAQKKLGNVNRKDYWKIVAKGLPDGMRYLLYFFFAYTFVNFTIFFFQSPVGKQSGPPTPLVWRGFSGHWMLFYYAAFVMHVSAINSSRPADPFQKR